MKQVGAAPGAFQRRVPARAAGRPGKPAAGVTLASLAMLSKARDRTAVPAPGAAGPRAAATPASLASTATPAPAAQAKPAPVSRKPARSPAPARDRSPSPRGESWHGRRVVRRSRSRSRSRERYQRRDRSPARPGRTSERDGPAAREGRPGPRAADKAPAGRRKGQTYFQLGWDDSDNTAGPLDDGASADVSCLMFGQGYVAGVDPQAQLARRQAYFKVLARKRKEEEAQALVAQEAQAAASAAEHTSAQDIDVDALLQQQDARTGRRALGPTMRSWAEVPLEKMSERDWRIFCEDYDIHLAGEDLPRPLRFWSEARMPAEILRSLQQLGFEHPTPIQRAALPLGLQCRDVVGVAETGSGKTAAFGIPLLAYVAAAPPEAHNALRTDGPLALVLAPTRELAQQIQAELTALAQYMSLSVVSVVGGLDIHKQAAAIQRGAHIVVATPGRLQECLSSNLVVFNQCRYAVLDEADRMLDDGFEEAVRAILEMMAPGTDQMRKCTVMFTATMRSDVQRLAETYMQNPAAARIGDEQTGSNKRIKQELFRVPDERKRDMVRKVLQRNVRPAIVFVNAKKECGVMGRWLAEQGFPNTVLHGDKSQPERERALEQFRRGSTNILVATDVAGRGLDIPGVAMVLNYDLPQDFDRYTHRIGRTGRAGQEGIAVSLWNDKDEKMLLDLAKHLRATGSAVPPDLERHKAVAGQLLGPIDAPILE